jgi:hypothetical protein
MAHTVETRERRAASAARLSRAATSNSHCRPAGGRRMSGMNSSMQNITVGRRHRFGVAAGDRVHLEHTVLLATAAHWVSADTYV